jgi:glutamate-1-semialdehyde aminotransferase
MLVNGVDMPGGRKFYVSSAHDDDVVDRTIEAFDKSLKELRAEGVV